MRTKFILVLLVFFLQACSAVLKSSEAPDYGFLPKPELLQELDSREAFHKSWVAGLGEYSKYKFKYIYIKPISTRILEANLAEKISDKEDLQDRIDEARELANYFRSKMELVIQNVPDYPLELVSQPKPDTFVLELALVELQPTNRAINTAGTIAGVFVPGGGLVKLAGKSRVAMEGLIKNSSPNVLLEQFKDRETDKASPFSVKDFQKYAHVRVALDDWSMQLVEISADPLSDIDDSNPISLNPF